jgi:glycosyltransferase involved in cell wall biosynthesis
MNGRVSGVSLVIPVRNEAESIADLFASIRAQTRPPDEVIIVDGGSTDGTADIARHLVGDDLAVQVVEAGTSTPGRGRNVGRSVARHSWIAFTDAGIKLDPRWLEQLSDAGERNPDAEVVYGTYEPQLASFLDSCALGAYVAPRQMTSAGLLRGPSVASMLLKAEAFDRVGGFPDLRAAEDQIFFERIERSSLHTVRAPEAVIYWQLPRTISATFRRFRLYSRQNVLVGRQRNWHYGVVRMYAVGAAIVAVAIMRNQRVLLLLPLSALARGAQRLWSHRPVYGLRFVINPLRIGGTTGLTLVLDAATFAGWISASSRRARTRQRPRSAKYHRPDAFGMASISK